MSCENVSCALIAYFSRYTVERTTKGGSVAVALGTLAFWWYMMPLRGAFRDNVFLTDRQ